MNFDNPFLDQVNNEESFEFSQENLNLMISSISLFSKKISGSSVYKGEGGLALIYLIASQSSSIQLNGTTSRLSLIKKSIEITEACLNDQKLWRNITFLMGAPGILAINCVAQCLIGRQDNFFSSVEKLLKLSEKAVKLDNSESELLYGKSGFISALIFLCKFEKGRDKKYRSKLSYSWPLYYQWKGKCYLGAAHGISGIFTTILESIEIIKSVPCDNKIKEELMKYQIEVSDTVEIILENFVHKSGNPFSSLESTTDRLVQWCHGAPGWIPLLIKLCKISKEKNQFETFNFYKNHIDSFGEVVWSRGLLKKGLGLCHGIPGNALSLLSIYRFSKDDKWLNRAKKFFAFSKCNFENLYSVPDNPDSLFEGTGGYIYLYLSLFNNNGEAFFPGFEEPYYFSYRLFTNETVL